MPEDVIEVVEVENVPVIHRFGKFAIGGIAGLTATILAEKLYDLALAAYRAKTS